jgi:Tfp pilus assembly protein PilX
MSTKIPSVKFNQTGAVLIASLVLLLIVTIVSTSMFRDVGSQEIMASNHRIKSRTQHTANSALREQWANLLNLAAGEQAIDARSRSFPTIYDQDLDGDSSTQEVDMTVDVDICFDGTTIAPGTDSEFRAYKFILRTTASDNTNATTRLEQGGYIVAPAPATVLAGTCP